MEELKEQEQQPQQDQQKSLPKDLRTNKVYAVLTIGGNWAQLFENSLARKKYELIHFDLGNPKFKLTEDIASLFPLDPAKKEDYLQFLARLNSSSKQASELIWKLDSYLHLSAIVLLDNSLLDTAIGQYILMKCKTDNIPVWAVALDERSSPLAAAFLKGVIYPETPDDLVKLCLEKMDRERYN